MMLTKEHLKYRVRSGRAYPTLINSEKPEVNLCLVNSMKVAFGCEGATLQDLEDESQLEDKLTQAFIQLIVDHSEIADSEDLSERRWQWLMNAEEIRQEFQFSQLADFEREFSVRSEVSMADVKTLLYSDLPEATRIKKIKKFEPFELVEKYNLAQVKGLLLRARNVRVTLDHPSISEARFLFRMLKFHQLVANINQSGKTLEIEISGSLDIFGVSQSSFGKNVCKFIGYVIQMPKWAFHADLNLKGRNLELRIDQSSDLKSDHVVNLQFVPPEFEQFIGQISKHLPKWSVSADCEVRNLGGQNYCVPDFSLKSPEGRHCFIELFHRHHQGQLRSRLRQLIIRPDLELVLGISTKIGFDPELESLLEQSKKSKVRTFSFRDFPTAKNAIPSIIGPSP